MVAIEVSEGDSKRGCGRDPDERSLVESGKWYPDVPHESIHVHEENLAAFEPLYQDESVSLLWTHFGGQGGMHLPHLVKLYAMFDSDGILCGIDFAYDYSIPPTDVRPIGCHVDESGNPVLAHEFDDVEIVREFTIDGPGGERIISVGKINPYELTFEVMQHFYPFRSFKLVCQIAVLIHTPP